MKEGSAECAQVNWKPWRGRPCCATRQPLGAFWYDTCISVRHNRKTGGQRGDESQIQVTTQTGHPGQRCGRANREMGRGACHLVWVWCSNSRKLSGGETVSTFLFLDAQRQTEAAGNTAGLLWVRVEYFLSWWGFSGLFNNCCKLVSTIYHLISK